MAPDFSVISREEIVVGVRQARNAKEQKKIYADLCCCSIAQIENILLEDEMAKHWTDSEIEQLKVLLENDNDYETIARHFPGRDARAIGAKVRDLYQKGILEHRNKQKPIGPGKNRTPDEAEIKYWQDRCAVAEAALEKRIKELAALETANAELRILAKMIGKAAEV